MAVCLTDLSNCQAAPKWSFRGRSPMKSTEGAPGPGRYGATSPDKDKFSRSATFGFGTSSRDGTFFGSLPGPGAYTPSRTSTLPEVPRWGFGSEARLRHHRRSTTPGPGSYDTRGQLGGQGNTF